MFLLLRDMLLREILKSCKTACFVHIFSYFESVDQNTKRYVFNLIQSWENKLLKGQVMVSFQDLSRSKRRIININNQ